MSCSHALHGDTKHCNDFPLCQALFEPLEPDMIAHGLLGDWHMLEIASLHAVHGSWVCARY